ncbi:hypothetical protein A2U01_0045004, partial [Trifolium medium]|nr:hypothetical protein [Trifolium medium]
LDKEADMLKEGVTKFGETPNLDAVAKHLFEDKQVSDHKFLEKHLSPNPLVEQTFIHEHTTSQPQPEQQQQQQQPEQPQPQPELNEPEISVDPENPIHQPPQSLTMDDLIISSEIFYKSS